MAIRDPLLQFTLPTVVLISAHTHILTSHTHTYTHSHTHMHTHTHTYTHAHTHTHTHTHSAIIGSGLCIFSRYPTMTAFTHQFSVTGGISDFTDGEIFAGKGILGCRIQTPVGNVVVYTLHVSVSVLEQVLSRVVYRARPSSALWRV